MRVCRESCTCKLEQPNDGWSQNLGVNFLRFAVRTAKSRSEITKKLSRIDEHSSKNRFWPVLGVQGRFRERRGAFGTRLGRAKSGSRAILGRPGLAKSGRETSKSEPGTVPRRSRARPERCRSVCDATSKVGRVIGTFFGRFCLVAGKLRCAVRISFYSVLLGYNVLLGSSDVSSERAM